MKILLKIFLITFVLASLPQTVYAKGTQSNKLKRGLINIVTAPIELPKQIKTYWKKGTDKGHHNVVWLISGTSKGLANMVGRVGSGLWDVLTFNIDLPRGYEPLMKPDYVCKLNKK